MSLRPSHVGRLKHYDSLFNSVFNTLKAYLDRLGWLPAKLEAELARPNTEIIISFKQGRDWLGNPTGRKEVHSINIISTDSPRRSSRVRLSSDRYNPSQLWIAFNDLVKLSSSYPNKVFVIGANGFKEELTPKSI